MMIAARGVDVDYHRKRWPHSPRGFLLWSGQLQLQYSPCSKYGLSSQTVALLTSGFALGRTCSSPRSSGISCSPSASCGPVRANGAHTAHTNKHTRTSARNRAQARTAHKNSSDSNKAFTVFDQPRGSRSRMHPVCVLGRAASVTPCSAPALPPTYNHPLWQAWDFAVDLCLAQASARTARPVHHRTVPCSRPY